MRCSEAPISSVDNHAFDSRLQHFNCKFLVDHRAKLDARNNAGATLHLSACYGWVGGITSDLIDARADMEATDPRKGEIALFVAYRNQVGR